MKKFLVVLLMIISQLSFAQVTKNIGDFNSVKVFDRIAVTLVRSTENKVEIRGKRSGEVELVNSNGDLKIRMKLDKLLQGEDIEVRVYYKDLKSIDASEGSLVSAEGVISQDEIELNAKAGAEITLKLEVRDVEVRSVTGGIVNLTGRSDEMEVTLGTGGVINAKEFVTSKTEVAIRAGGQAEVYATDHIETDIKAGGDIVVYGNPKSVNEKSSLGGSVTIKK
ncbi:MAG TPA: head GIN domain-containing protein [Flavobacterium sp.]